MTSEATRERTAERTVTEIRADLERAERAVEEVLDRIKGGDRKVGPDDLEAAESRVRFARARLEGEERRREEEAENARLERLEELKERANKELDPEPMRKLRKKAEAAVSAYVAACEAHNRTVDEIAGELSNLEPLPDGWSLYAGSSGRTFTAAGRSVRPIHTISEVSRIAYEMLRKHIPRGFIDFDRF